MKYFILILFLSFSLFASRPQDPKLPFSYQIEEVNFENKKDGIRLSGTLTSPYEKAIATVILIPGYGALDRDETFLDHHVFLVLSDYLTRQKINVLRFDKRGVGKSSGSYQEATRVDFASDVIAAIDFLKERDLKTPIGLIGHSEGGIIAPMVASEVNDLSFLVLMAPPGVYGARFILEQTELLGKASGQSQDEIEKELAIVQQIINIILEEPNESEANEKLKKIIPPQYLPIAMEFNSKNFRFFLKTDPVSDLRKIQIPLLILYGDRDWITPPKTQIPPIAQALEEAGNTKYSIQIFPHLNHLFQTCVTGAQEECATIDETIAPIALETISNWINEILKEGKLS